jgi:dTDP-4-amino-4,6-dideoxygalactose transaminase
LTWRPRVPFNKPRVGGREYDYVRQAVENLHLSGGGPFTRRCHDWLLAQTGAHRAFLTTSCTAALEMATLLAGLDRGDEVIMPSFTFVSTANAVVLRGATPVFVDVRPDTLNIDETQIEAAITPRTRALMVVHYAGVACEMTVIGQLAARHNLLVIEDAAQAVLSTYQGRPLGSFGDAAAISFHETKNVVAGEGGALLVNAEAWAARAEILWEKGTNRSRFFRGEIDKYTWVDVGSSFLPGEIVAAFLYAQLEEARSITADRLRVWHHYHARLAPLEADGRLRRPVIPADCAHNAHMYYVLLPDGLQRTKLLADLKAAGIDAVFHYVPLHLAPAGRRYCRVNSPLRVTERAGETLVRLPIWPSLPLETVDWIVDVVSLSLTGVALRC